MKASLSILSFFCLFSVFSQSFGPEQFVVGSVEEVRDVHTADLDGDGDMDVLSASTENDKIAWYENDGLGNFSSQKVISTGIYEASVVFTTDLDGDGDEDVLGSSVFGDVTWFKNDGTGHFDESEVLIDYTYSAISIDVADVDNDGDLDILLGLGSVSNTIVLLENQGEGNFTDGINIGFDLDFVTSIHAADLDGDGDVDVLSSSFSDDKIAWYENDGSGQFGEQRIITTSADGASSVYSADFDNDGDIDVVSASSLDDDIAWYENDGSNNFGEKQTIHAFADGARSVRAADLDGDGDMDILSASESNGDIAWHENEGGGNFALRILLNGGASGAYDVHVSDLDGDGDLDVLSAAWIDDVVAWYENDGSANFSSEVVISTNPDNPVSIQIADIDGDGDMDVLSASDHDNKIVWYENEIGNGFAGEQIITTDLVAVKCLHVADINGDGIVDVLSASAADDKIAWYENDGSGEFGGQQVITTSADFVKSIYTSDLDGDGDLDVLSASTNSGEVAWYENDGAGGFGVTQIIENFSELVSYVSSADLDGDGDEDVLVTSRGLFGLDRQVAWYENDGEGNFGSINVIVTTTDIFSLFKTADIDGDGDIDLITLVTDSSVAWYENDGNGTFTLGAVIDDVDNGGGVIHVEDLDGDGDIDVLKASDSNDIMAWFENNGSGNFGSSQAIASTTSGSIEITSIQSADLDNDGDLDVIYTETEDNKIVWHENLLIDVIQVFGCTNEQACNYDIQANTDNNSCVFPVGCEICSGEFDGTGVILDNDLNNDGVCDDPEVAGCTNSLACNFNSVATIDKGTCLLPAGCESCSGETDGSGEVIDNDEDDDGICNSNEIIGCMDPLACNYDSSATDEGVCLANDQCGNCGGEDIAGCTDSMACNFDPSAACDNGSCLDNCCTSDVLDNFSDCPGNAENIIYTFTEGAPGEGVMIIINSGSTEPSYDEFYVYDGPDINSLQINTDVYGNHAGKVFYSTGVALTIRISSDVSVSCATNSAYDPFDIDAYCGLNVLGCNNPNAENFNPSATLNDGSCELVVNNDVCIDAIQVFEGQTVIFNGSAMINDTFSVPAGTNGENACNSTDGWCSQELSILNDIFYYFETPASPFSLTIETVYDGSNTWTDTQLAVFKNCGGSLVAANDDSGEGNMSYLSFAMGDLDINSSYIILVDGYLANTGTAILELDFEPDAFGGCTDSAACNYDPSAQIDDGSCEFIIDDCGNCGGNEISGCTDTTACNYNLNASCDSGLCEYEDECGNCGGTETAGCIDSTACNYDASASCDDGTCTYEFNECGECGGPETEGCTDPEACNYDSEATCDNDSCLELDACGNCGGTGLMGCTSPIACNYNPEAVCDDGSCYVPVPEFWNQIGEDINGEQFANLGDAVSISADGTIVAAGTGHLGAAHVQVFKYINGEWNQIGQTIDDPNGTFEFGRDIDLSDDGTVLAVGDALWNGPATSSGLVRVYKFTGSIWEQIGQDITGDNAFDYFGTHLALSADGNRIAGGAYAEDTTGDAAGQVRVYENINDSWEQIGQDINGAGANQSLGSSVEFGLNGNILAVSSSQGGNIKVFQYSGSSWLQIGNTLQATAGHTFRFDHIGLSGDGTTLAYSEAIFETSQWIETLFVYRRVGNNWIQLGEEIVEPGSGSMRLDLDYEGNILAVGDGYSSYTGPFSGQVRVYNLQGDNWLYLGNIIDAEASGDHFGTTVKLTPDGKKLVAGGYENEGDIEDSGHVRVFELTDFLGCTDPTACNFDPGAICDDGTCNMLDACGNCGGSEISGCTDALALNYDSTATCDDGSCIFDFCGECTVWSPILGQCIQDPTCLESCVGDYNGDGIVTTADLTIFLTVLYGQCFPNPLGGDSCYGDLTDDGFVNSQDLTIFLVFFGNSCD